MPENSPSQAALEAALVRLGGGQRELLLELASNPALVQQLLESVPGLREQVDELKKSMAEQLSRPCGPKACRTCPFRRNHGEPGAKARAWFYERETRHALWSGHSVVHDDGVVPGVAGEGLKDGGMMTCHLTFKQTGPSLEETVAHRCAGAVALQHRALLHWFTSGGSALTRKGIQRTVAAMFDVKPEEVVVQTDGDRRLTIGSLYVEMGDLLEHAHPAAGDPFVFVEEVALTSEELAEIAASVAAA